jgi:hypothetical protein
MQPPETWFLAAAVHRGSLHLIIVQQSIECNKHDDDDDDDDDYDDEAR